MKAEDIIKDENADITNLDDDFVINDLINKNSVKLPESKAEMIQRTGLYWLRKFYILSLKSNNYLMSLLSKKFE